MTLLILVTLLAASALPVTDTEAATFMVNDQLDEAETATTLLDPACRAPGGSCTLRAAVQQANATPDADEILLPSGTYNLTLRPVPGGADDALNGDLDVVGPLTIRRTGDSDAVIDAGARGRLFEVLASGCLVLEGVVIQNGDAAPEGDPDACAGRGGGACVQGGTPTGLGPCTAGELRLVSSTVRSSKSAQGGAGLWNREGLLTLQLSSVHENISTGNGGGIGSLGGTVSLTQSTVRGNLGNLRGGGIALLDGAELMLLQSTVSGNSVAGRGGGIAILDTPRATLTNATVSGNSASETGGGLYTSCTSATCTTGSGLVLNNVTLASNRSTSTAADANGGGIVRDAIAPDIHVSNSIFGNNTPDDCVGALDSRGFNLIEVPAKDKCTVGGLTVGSLSCDPMLAGLAKATDDPTETHALLASPALDSGNPGGEGTPCETVDQLGRARTAGLCDMGAVEQVLDLCVTNFGSICKNRKNCSLTPDDDDDHDGKTNKVDCCPTPDESSDCVDKDGCALLQSCPCERRADGTAWKSHKAWAKCVKRFRRPKCPLPSLAAFAGCGVRQETADDTDGDLVPNAEDNCPTDFNPKQCNADAADEIADKTEELGDACDTDSDNDGIKNGQDPCPTHPPAEGKRHQDRDGDKAVDECDNCPKTFNEDQADIDKDGFGDACDRCRNLATDDNSDTDNDGIGDDCDCCPETPELPFGSVDCDGCTATDKCEPTCNHGACHDDFTSLRDRNCQPK